MEIIEIIGFSPNSEVSVKLPLFIGSVSAGIPNPVDSEVDAEIDLNEYLVTHPAATFFVRVSGLNLEFSGIADGDLLIVDTSIEPKDGKIVVAILKNHLTIKIYRVIDGEIFLESHNHQFIPLKIEPYMEYTILGTVTKIIHNL